ncbi:sugar transferase [Sphingomonas sp. CJ20]
MTADIYGGIKRAGDLAVAAGGLVFLAPAILLSVAMVWLEDPSAPPFIRQERIGRGERPFFLVKLRTMRAARFSGARKLSDAERMLRSGSFFRRYSVDELPQLWNVLCGQMSLIGPRPMPIAYLPYLSPVERMRHRVRPGMSGLAQVSGRNFLSWDQKFGLDVEYVRAFGWRQDARIFLLTLLRLVHPTGVGVRGADLPVQSLHELREPWPVAEQMGDATGPAAADARPKTGAGSAI